MFRTLKPQSSHKVSRKKHLPDDQSPAHIPPQNHPTLQLQSLIGNHATQRMIQRMPSAGIIKAALGEPKADKTYGIGRFSKVKQNSTKYRAVLNAVGAYDMFMGTRVAVGQGPIQAQFSQALALLDQILTAASAYNAKDNKKARYMKNTLKPEVAKEKARIPVSLMRVLKTPASFSGKPLAMAIMGERTITLNDTAIVGGDKGGTSEVTEYGGTDPGFFKANKNTLYKPHDYLAPIKGETSEQKDLRAESAFGDLQLELMERLGAEAGSEKFNALNNEYLFGVQTAGIKSQNSDMAKRDVAMSRLNQLLGMNIIAKAQMAIKIDGEGKKTEGSLMEKATGKSGDRLARDGGFYDEAGGETKDTNNAKQASLQDPKLMQLLSKLQLIDQLAFQVDRNVGNYYIQTDPTGKVIGLTGIDNDFAFGEAKDLTKRNNTLPALSKYADEETATAIINLDPELLKIVMSDLLDEREIAALLERLKTMQEHLKDLQSKNKLLKPGDWNTAMAQNLLDEKVGEREAYNYYQQLVKTRPNKPQKK